jgi:hypothetical protein
MRRVRKSLRVDVEYTVGRQDPSGGVFEGGVLDPEFIGELVIDVGQDPIHDDLADAFVPSGKAQVHLRGSRRALAGLATYLLALCELETSDPDHHEHFDDVRNSNGVPSVHLIVHAPSP